MKKVNIMGLTFDNLRMAQTLDKIEKFIQIGTPHKIFTPNVALYVYSRWDELLKQTYETCDLLPVDGMGIYYASHLLDTPVAEAVSAVFIMLDFLPIAEQKGYKIYLLGTKKQILDKAIENIKKQYPNIVVAGAHDGYFELHEEDKVVADIVQCQPDIIFLGMSSPKKEAFVQRNLDRMNVPVSLGVGGTIDVIAGVYHLAPLWMRNVGLEWFYRLIQEPRRMWKRYLITNSVFLFLLCKILIAKILGFKREV